jgi:hypothetical protein
VALITTKLLDFVHRPDLYKPENTTFRKLDLFPSSGEGGGTYSTEQPKACLSTGSGRWTKSRSLIVMSVTHHRQNPLECKMALTIQKTINLKIYNLEVHKDMD